MHLKFPRQIARILSQPSGLPQLAGFDLLPAGHSSPSRKSSPEPRKLVEVRSFGRNPGDLRMLEYVPPGRAGSMPLVVVLHGCLQDAAGFDRGSGWTSLARRYGFAVLYPQQTSSNNSNLCFNWFRPSQVTRDRGELASIREMIANICERHAIDQSRIYVMGLSAGGAMTAALLACYPELFAAGSIVAGLPFGAARDAMTALSVMKNGASREPDEWAALARQAGPEEVDRYPAVSIWHGTVDHIVSVENARASAAQWTRLKGLSLREGKEQRMEGGTRTEWRDAEGRVAVALYLLDGFDHGLPVSPPARPAANDIDRFMTPSTLPAPEELVRAWGLASK
ncbi:PHB depolymerase family esterase [Rhizobium sp. BK251]|uniref:extracellular catalytic domain type 1 short-chain-length polyhydroxyalkanoate depolymerase n=1 Tax=Rhizobium sp. BK251 TaxID=2512125 RepID=UPI00104A8475|nr:PHB depolymerase family esterase [Rhizobium sp. BK251]TCL70327.1 poly(hydroxyalkanoate) depolymerase family esterase [Rhizobium sp. BK251]